VLCKDAVRREFDVVLAWSVDRLGRSLQDLIGFLSEIHAAGVDLYLHVQGLDTFGPYGVRKNLRTISRDPSDHARPEKFEAQWRKHTLPLRWRDTFLTICRRNYRAS
jgi:Resolvase, N terminal domain